MQDMDEYYASLERFFRSFDLSPLPFYDTPQRSPFRELAHKKVQIKRRILEYRAKY